MPIAAAHGQAYDMIALPGAQAAGWQLCRAVSATSELTGDRACAGGMPGAERLRDCAVLEELLRAQSSAGKPVAAICATPAV
jgi:hypothetical protein